MFRKVDWAGASAPPSPELLRHPVTGQVIDELANFLPNLVIVMGR